MRQKFITFVILAMLVTMSLPSFAVGGEEMIKVGLSYGERTESHVNLYSKLGFTVQFMRENQSNYVWSLLEYENLQVAPDGRFLYSGETPLLQSTPSVSVALEPYHIQIGTAYGSASEALEAQADLLQKQSGVYPVFENGWRLYYGAYGTAAEATAELSRVQSLYGSDTYLVQPNPKRVQVLSSGKLVFSYDSSAGDFYLQPFADKGDDGVVKMNGRSYRGGIGFKRFPGSDLTIINYIPMSHYLYGVLPKEMSGSWPLEALKAQAVAARNYTISRMGEHGNHGFDICATTHCQVYGGYDYEKQRSNQAVDETAGKLLKYNSTLVQTFYHSNSGGHTENIENIWSSKLPYIVGVNDPYSVGSPNTDWTITYSKQELASKLKAAGYDIGTLGEVYIASRSQNNRVLELVFIGSKDTVTLKKEETRKVLGYRKIKSMWFDIGDQPEAMVVDSTAYYTMNVGAAYVMTANRAVQKMDKRAVALTDGQQVVTVGNLQTGDDITFTGHGFGHGLGMSQWGAKNMAEQGFTYDQILTHYYKGTHIE